MNKNTRPAGALTTVLDPEALLAAAQEQLPLQYPGWDPAVLGDGPLPQMILTVDRGEAAVVNGEGVGAIADEHGIVDVWFTYGFNLIRIALTLPTIAAAFTGEEIDLADGIRTFGGRLDANHYRWYARHNLV
ncbi:hypothetical protein ACIPY5_19745 [Microbacterium sp. NPDC089698]|uniref:hypothetical protein n=1 Tax=Microbacterium sp. NPDC089698 TaxID=3364200 RepID=UPI0037FF70A7